ncbi:hypothetical protein SE15_10895 [Thermanaerothrix daxensis]|uniref:Uncharacterized protein n=1 Tax=Thermanaerothrix daxensis TaxID=869279 RepID=A0A0N8GQ37_9CHLR|nr:hypothetical protein [Thermanaerothrix daxensis]KPL82610.1 hypothetical protein SE15_10895 [Thermanaerothrix daxensis]
MNEEISHHDIRRLLKTFGVQADEAILRYLEQHPGDSPLRLRITLEDVTEYGTNAPHSLLHLVVEGEIRRTPHP